MVDYNSQIKDLQDELKKTKYNKRTQFHVGLVKAKIARLKERDHVRRSSAKPGEGYSVRKTGDGTVLLLGFPSVGKSTLLNGLTNADSAVAAYEFTTLTVIPGLLEYKHAKIQILDVPGIVKGAASGRGRGREVLAVLRSADLAILIVDVHNPKQY
ncbi:MAG: GTPase, partial [Candidatus Woesearchaeota archaeon]